MLFQGQLVHSNMSNAWSPPGLPRFNIQLQSLPSFLPSLCEAVVITQVTGFQPLTGENGLEFWLPVSISSNPSYCRHAKTKPENTSNGSLSFPLSQIND